jgi:peptide/nickel transport system permease protein
VNIRIFLQRVIQLIPVLLGVSILAFAILHLAPGDPAILMLPGEATRQQIEELHRNLGLDKPLYLQYLAWISAILRGNLGTSFYTNQPVIKEIMLRFPATVLLTVAALGFALVVGVILGIFAAMRRDTVFDRATMIVSVLGWSMPPFWIGLILIIVFAVRLGWLPTGGMYSLATAGRTVGDLAKHLILPALTLGLRHMSYVARLTRSSMLEVLGEDYVRTARAKGLANSVVMIRHALRNALIPVITVAGVSVGRLLGGAVVVETVFGWPGLGSFVVKAILARDFPLVQGSILFIATTFVLVNFLVDLIYSWVDPRIRYA